MEPVGERNHAIQMFALYPELVFAGRIARVLALLKHRHHHHFDGYTGCRGSAREREKQTDQGGSGHPTS